MAKILGQLERAQFENYAGTPTPASTGRFYCDITNPLAAVPMFYNGSAWRTLLMGQAAAVSQNSGTACTVDWSKGTTQQVVLTGHCLISFTNPQAGQVHTLYVTQRELYPFANNATPYQFKLNMLDQAVRRGLFQPRDVLRAGESGVFAWFYQSGLQPGYSNVPAPLPAPAILSLAGSGCLDINPFTGSIFGNQTASPFAQLRRYTEGGYRFDLGLVNPTTPATLPYPAGACYGVEYSPDGAYVYTVGSISPFVSGHAVDIYGNASTQFANPGTLPAGVRFSVSVHPSGTHVAVSGTTTPFCEIYPIGPQGFGTKLTNPLALPGASTTAGSCAFSPFGDFIAVAVNAAPYLEMWPFDVYTGWGAKISALSPALPNGVGSGTGKQLAWRPQGDMLAICTQGTSPYVQIVGFNRATSTWGAITAPFFSGAPAAQCMGLAWSPCGNYLAIVSQTSPYLFVYDVSAGTGFPSAPPLTLDAAAAAANDVKWSPSGEHLVLALNASPFMMVIPAPRKQRNYIRLSE